ncbi:bacillithiol biosynthesis cysteine-adding enzyme BshC [Paenibacillus ferrarius]|uniref:bacillithiol biosynthesis cysteine-adding enzyme BshC n=1 Tax=Paenibacillus ferrarius TaxID=1469647 RepID=UPI003D2A144C
MQIDSFHWKKSQPLAEDYVAGSEAVRALYPHHFASAASWETRVKWLDEAAGRPQADREQLVQVLRTYNERIGNQDQAFASIAALHDAKTLAIVGGQQAGLFGGQLLVLYKAITLIQAAREWSSKLGRSVVPIFWIAGEDHDFDEVNHLFALTQAQQIEKIKIEHPTGQRTSVSRLPVSPEAWEEALTALDHTLMDTEFKESLLGKLRASVEQGATLSDAFARWMAMLFGEYGLVLIDSDEPALRKLEAGLFEQLIVRNEELAQALAASKEAVVAAGYGAQADIQENGANLFVFAHGQRLLLHREDGVYTDRKGTVRFTPEELREKALREPESLSNNVMTRPLMQDYLFPVLATVLGPGEIAYWSLTKEAFERFGLQMPIVLPRMEFTLIEGTIKKQMDKYDFSLNDVIERYEQKKQAWLAEQDTLQLPERFEQVKAIFRDSYQPLVESLGSINSGVKKLGDTNMAKILEQIDYLQHKASEAHQTQFDSAIRQLERVRLTIIPFAKPQERVYNGCAYLNRYGDGWLHALLDTPIPVDGVHRVFYL